MMKNILSICCVLLFSMQLLPVEKVYDIRFAQVEQRARELSPHIRLIRKEIQLKMNESESRLQKSNPSLDYSREFVKEGSFSETEQVFSISKSFEMPWLYANRRKGHHYTAKALELEKESRIRDFVARMKSGYAALALMSQRLKMLNQVKDQLQTIAGAAASRKKQGVIAGYQKTVVDIALLNLNGKILSISMQRRELENRWKIEMGFSAHAALHLVDGKNIGYKILSSPIPHSGDYEKIINDMPALARLELEGQQMITGLKFEKMNIIPDINLSFGYKEVGHNLKGYVLGLSFDLPILNQNRNAVRKKSLDLEIHNNRVSMFKQETRSRIKEMLYAVSQYTLFLMPGPGINNTLPARLKLEPIIAAYAEGLLKGGEMISILITYLEAMEQYHIHLHAYLSTLFRLEALTGKQLITF